MLVAQQMDNQTLSFPMLALPFFILSGSLMMSGRLGENLIGFATELVQRYRGGLGSVTILGSCVFGSVSGSAIADLFAAGVLPGLILTSGLVMVCNVSARLRAPPLDDAACHRRAAPGFPSPMAARLK